MPLRLGIALTNPYSKGTYVLCILPDVFRHFLCYSFFTDTDGALAILYSCR